jgi:hypothetical protein
VTRLLHSPETTKSGASVVTSLVSQVMKDAVVSLPLVAQQGELASMVVLERVVVQVMSILAFVWEQGEEQAMQLWRLELELEPCVPRSSRGSSSAFRFVHLLA